MQTSRALVVALPLLLGSFFTAPCDRALRRVEGYTVVKVTSIKGTFNGCAYDRLVELIDGTILRCSSYGYQYAYAPDAVLFARSVAIEGKSATITKLLVEGELYDVMPR